MSLPANQVQPPPGLLQWGSLPEVDSWGSEVSEVLLLSARSWITWPEPPVWLWQILTSRQAIVANNGVAERSPDGRYSPQHYHKWPHHTEQHKLNCLMFTASREISEHLSLWPVTLTRRKLRNMSSPCRTEPGQGIIININILSGRAWQVAWADSNMWADTLDKNWSRVAVITRTVSPLHTHTWSPALVNTHRRYSVQHRYFRTLPLGCQHQSSIWCSPSHHCIISTSNHYIYIEKVLHKSPPS